MTVTSMHARRSPRAHQRFRVIVEQANASAIVLHDAPLLLRLDHEEEGLTKLEAYVYGVEPALRNALAVAHGRYLDFIGWTEDEFARFRAEEREAFAEFFRGEHIYAAEEAAAFMLHVCELPRTQAILWVARAQVQMVRAGYVDECVDTPQWAYGRVQEAEIPVPTFDELDDDIPF